MSFSATLGTDVSKACLMARTHWQQNIAGRHRHFVASVDEPLGKRGYEQLKGKRKVDQKERRWGAHLPLGGREPVGG